MPANKPYFQEFKRTLDSKLKQVSSIVDSLYIDQFIEGINPDAAFFLELSEGITKHPLRYYQKDAVYTLHSIYTQAIDYCRSPINVQNNLKRQLGYKHIIPLLEKVGADEDNLAPFIGFEMATGSGKTMLMGAAIYYLNKYHYIPNFLIITPNLEIYKKTVRNFTKGSSESVWSDEVPFNYNLITSDNYKASQDLFSSEKDSNVFVFNIAKFGSNATQTKKNWESSVWKDSKGNTISLLEYLSQNDLVIITDEAHHAQSRKAKGIINIFKPIAVLEYTATAIERSTNQNKINQTIVYKYSIKQFLEDKYGKRVRVLALPGDLRNTVGRQTVLSDIEKYKLQTFFLVHLVKKKALSLDINCRDLKAVGFVKVKNLITFSEIVEKYIKDELSSDSASLELILEKSKLEDTETTNLIFDMYKNDYNSNISLLQKDIQTVADTAILIHSKSDKLVRKQFDDIQRNNVEIVIFIDILNEGIDLPNIYSMVVINDNDTDFKTSVKQIVGRGVRLNKPNREFDDVEDNDLLTHSEKLHIVCDKGAAFEQVVLEIQEEFGLTDKTFSIERGSDDIIPNYVKKDKLLGLQIPRITIDFKRKEGAKILDVLQNYDKIINDFLASNSFKINDSFFLKYSPNSFFTEIDLFIDKFEFHRIGESQGWNSSKLIISEKDMKEIYGRVLKDLKPIPDITKTYQIFLKYGELLNNLDLLYYNLDDVDYKLAINRFKDSFTYFFIHYVENDYFVLDLDTIDSESNSWQLQNVFKTENIKIKTNSIENDKRNSDDVDELIALIKSGYYFYGYENSAYDYDKFDSYPEKLLADYVNHLIELEADKSSPFWLRNERNIFFKYGSHKYYPDFIFFYKNIIYVIEIKGEKFSNIKKNRLLLELNNTQGLGSVQKYIGLVVFELQMKKLSKQKFIKKFDEFRAEAEVYFEQIQKKALLVPEDEVSDNLKFAEYVPTFEPKQAYDHFVNDKEIRSVKWLKVNSGSYPSSVFALLIKNDAIGMQQRNKWLLMDSNISNIDSINNKVISCYHPLINDPSYNSHITVMYFSLKEEIRKFGMFNETVKIIVLSDESETDVTILDTLQDFKPFGFEFSKTTTLHD